jgi:uncharacterized DUF497 family protein
MARGPRLDFDWDASNLRHLASHRISHSEFEQAMMNGPVLVDFSDESGEERWYALGATDSLRVLFLVFNYRGESVRPITGWDAGKKLREAYFRRKGE